MKSNFKCPKCKSDQIIGKRLHATWTCPKCRYSLVPTREMKMTGKAPYRVGFTFNKERSYNPNYKRPFKKFVKREVTNG